MARLLDIRTAPEPRDVIHQTVEALAAGQIVGLPTEGRYVAAGLAVHAGVLERLDQLMAAFPGPVSIAVKGLEESRDLAPEMSSLANRLARRVWPGPVGLLVPAQKGSIDALPARVARRVAPEGFVCLRNPNETVLLETLQLLPAPLVLFGEFTDHRSQDATDMDQRHLDLLIDVGPITEQLTPTVLRVEGESYRVVRQGVVDEEELRSLTSELFIFVCTGNTCRSPLAEGLFRKILTEKLHCSADQLLEKGYAVASAGLAASFGAPASIESVGLAERKGIDLRGHESQPLTDRLLAQADRIYTMTRGHRDSILSARPDAADRVFLLSNEEEDVPDPIGCGLKEYEHCEREIARHVQRIVDELDV